MKTTTTTVNKQLNLLLNLAYHCEEPKLILRWIKTFHSLFLKEFKKVREERDAELIDKLIQRIDILFHTLCGISEEEREIFGPSIFESLLKVREIFEVLQEEERKLAEEEAEENSTQAFTLTQAQKESMERLLDLDLA